jgi:DNA recombination protein RmuC
MDNTTLFAIIGGFITGLALGLLLLWIKLQQKATQYAYTQQQAEQHAERVLQERLEAEQHLLTSQHTQVRDDLQDSLKQSQAEVLHLSTTTTRLSTQLETLQEEHARWQQQLETHWEQQFNQFLGRSLEELQQRQALQAQTTWIERQSEFLQTVSLKLQPLNTMLTEYKAQLEGFYQRGAESQTRLDQRVTDLMHTQSKLATALGHNQGRGDWGELSLMLLLEDSGLTKDVHYITQGTIGEDRSRPDVQVKMPNGRCLFIDAKALQLAMPETNNQGDAPLLPEEAQAQRYKRAARSLREAMKSLITRSYQDKLDASADFVILYLPKESMLSDALHGDPTLFEDAYRQKVFLSGPLNLLALLKMINHSWQQDRLSEDASAILDMGQTLYTRVANFVEAFEKVGKGLDSSVKGYNDAVTKFLDGRALLNPCNKWKPTVCEKPAKPCPKNPRCWKPCPIPFLPLPACNRGLTQILIEYL